MRSVYIFLFILVIQTAGFTLDDVQCNYVYSQKCYKYVNNYNIVDYNSSVIDYCTTEDIPNEINFTVISDEIGGKELTDVLKIDFTPPKTECRYGIALLVNPSIRNERECALYKFQGSKNIDSNVHTVEKTICILMNTNPFVRYNDNTTVSLCKDNIALWFQYIYTGCYALRFHINRQQYIIKGHKFLNTTYKRMEVVEPQFTCRYDTRSNLDQSSNVSNFAVDTSLPVDTGLLLKMTLIPNRNDNIQKPCIWHGQQPVYTWTINLVNNVFDNHNCSVVTIQTTNGEFMKTIRCNSQIQNLQTGAYCFILRLIDERCHKNTVWKPPVGGNIPCTWIKRCAKSFESLPHIENTNVTKSDKLLNTNSYFLLLIIGIVLIISVIVGIFCFVYYLRIRKQEINLYVNPHQEDFVNLTCVKPATLNGNDNEKELNRDNFTCNDIILLYVKSSMSFMALMKDFRKVLTKICSCSVHDWHDGAEWNDVAKVGAVLWFTELLNNGCRVVWVDIPATRSVVISNSRESDSNLRSKLSRYYEIGDFRDTAYPVVLELAKRDTKDAIPQYRRHFVVRFEGLESSDSITDPFLGLSPHARYLMPRHLTQLCSHLSSKKAIMTKYEIKAEEDLLQQRLKFTKMEPLI